MKNIIPKDISKDCCISVSGVGEIVEQTENTVKIKIFLIFQTNCKYNNLGFPCYKDKSKEVKEWRYYAYLICDKKNITDYDGKVLMDYSLDEDIIENIEVEEKSFYYKTYPPLTCND